MSDKKYIAEKTGGWKTKSTNVVYENPWIKVSHEEVLTPKGTDGIYGVVHFKNTAIGVVPIDDEGNTWLVKQSRYALNQYTWEIPEGGCPYGASDFSLVIISVPAFKSVSIFLTSYRTPLWSRSQR